MSEILMKTYLELAQILPPDCKSCRELELEAQIAEMAGALRKLAEFDPDPAIGHYANASLVRKIAKHGLRFQEDRSALSKGGQ